MLLRSSLAPGWRPKVYPTVFRLPPLTISLLLTLMKDRTSWLIAVDVHRSWVLFWLTFIPTLCVPCDGIEEMFTLTSMHKALFIFSAKHTSSPSDITLFRGVHIVDEFFHYKVTVLPPRRRLVIGATHPPNRRPQPCIFHPEAGHRSSLQSGTREDLPVGVLIVTEGCPLHSGCSHYCFRL